MVAIRYGLSIKIVKFIYCLKIFFSTIVHVVGKLTAWLE